MQSFGRMKFALNFKSYLKDEYPGVDDESLSQSLVYSCKFNPCKNSNFILALAYEDGKIVIQDTRKFRKDSYVIEKQAHLNAILDISWVQERNDLLTAVADSSLSLWSLSSGLIHVQQFKSHLRPVRCVDSNQWDTCVFASGGRDCHIFIWDKRCHSSRNINSICFAHYIEHKSTGESRSHNSHIQNSIVSLLFSQQYQLISAGASDGQIKIWDLRKTYSRRNSRPLSLHTLEHPGHSSFKGYTSMCLSPYSEKLYTSCLDGNIYAYHLANPTLKPVSEYFGHRPNTYFAKICLSPCGAYLLSGSSDDNAYIWLTDIPGFPIASLDGHDDEVTSVAWSDFNYGQIVTCSDDMKHRIYKNLYSEQESNQDLRGRAIPYQINSLQLLKGRGHKIAIQSSCLSTYKKNNIFGLSNSRICYGAHLQLLPQLNKKSDSENVFQARTPSSSTKKSYHVTPGTSERKTLLAWLSSTKKTPQSSGLTENLCSKSIERKKITLKRKLTDLMEEGENQENNYSESKNDTKVQFPKSVLVEREENILSTPSTSVAKELKYNDSQCDIEKITAEAPRKNVEDISSFTPLEDSTAAISPNKSSFHNKSHSSLFHCRILTSPTANLPNYVIDGRSPHNRCKVPTPKKKRPDWLTSLRKQKYKSDEEPKKLPQTKSTPTRRRFTRQK